MTRAINPPNLTKQDKIWAAESDARTLAEADIIKGDSLRLKAAASRAKIMAKDAADQAKAMQKVARPIVIRPKLKAKFAPKRRNK